MNLQTILFLDGSETSEFLLNYITKNKIFNIKKIIISPNSNKQFINKIKNKFTIIISNLKKHNNLDKYDIGFSYYDFKVPLKILKKFKIGVVNFHPSFLPYNRGRHSVFWAINDLTPLGATSHWMNQNFDDGEIFLQKKIKNIKFKNAKTLYALQLKSLNAVIKDTIKSILKNKIIRIKQDFKKATYHYASEIKAASTININQKIDNHHFFRLIQSTTFNNKTGIFLINGKRKSFITSEYLVKKSYYKQKYDIDLNNIFMEINIIKKISYEIFLGRFKIIIKSKLKE